MIEIILQPEKADRKLKRLFYFVRTFRASDPFHHPYPQEFLQEPSREEGLIATISFPYLQFAREVGMAPLPSETLGAMFGIVICYALTADVLKVWFFKKYKNR